MTNTYFAPLFGGVRSNVRTSSIARCKARDDFLFLIIGTFMLALTVQTL